MIEAELAALFPEAAKLAIATEQMWGGFSRLPAEEQALGARAVEKRRRELSAGRHAARAALGALGIDNVGVIARGEAGAPRWPEGVCGSITHCPGFAAAVVARIGDGGVRSLGFDAEIAEPLKPALVDMICAADERAHVATLPAAPAGTDWFKLAFSCKEAFYKAYYPHGRTLIDFLQVRIRFEAKAARYRVEIIDDAVPSADGQRAIAGGYLCDGERVYSAAVL